MKDPEQVVLDARKVYYEAVQKTLRVDRLIEETEKQTGDEILLMREAEANAERAEAALLLAVMRAERAKTRGVS